MHPNGPKKDSTKNIVELYAAIGYVAHSWEHLMVRLFLFHTSLSNGGDVRRNLPTFSALSNARAQQSATEQLAYFLLSFRTSNGIGNVGTFGWQNADQDPENSVLIADIKTIFKRIGRLSQRRNIVVHGTISDVTSTLTDENGVERSVSGLYLQASPLSGASVDASKYYCLDLNEVISIGKDLEKVRSDFNTLCDRVLVFLNIPVNF